MAKKGAKMAMTAEKGSPMMKHLKKGKGKKASKKAAKKGFNVVGKRQSVTSSLNTAKKK